MPFRRKHDRVPLRSAAETQTNCKTPAIPTSGNRVQRSDGRRLRVRGRDRRGRRRNETVLRQLPAEPTPPPLSVRDRRLLLPEHKLASARNRWGIRTASRAAATRLHRVLTGIRVHSELYLPASSL